MVSKVEICSLALQNIGAKRIADLATDTKNAIECRNRYDTVRLALLESYLWDFAIKRVALAKLTTAPSWGYESDFALPADFVRLAVTEDQLLLGTTLVMNTVAGIITLQFNGAMPSGDDYRIEALADGTRVFRCNDGSKNVLYVFDQENTAQFSPMFVEVLGMELSVAISNRIECNASLTATVAAKLEQWKKDAKMVNSQQNIVKVTRRSALLQARRGY